jgi:hypothetical protein
MTSNTKKYAPIGVIISLILLNISYTIILISGMQKPFGILEIVAYVFEIIAMGLMIRFHMNKTGWIVAITGFVIILLIKAYSLYQRGFLLNKDLGLIENE